MKKRFLILFLTSNFCFSQTIINTENLLREIDSTLSVKLNVEANFNVGNINLAQVNNSLTFGKRIKNSLIRISFGHEYIEEDSQVIANDWMGQIRYNRYFNDNSFFLFLQGQNVKSLSLNHRYLLGSGYRHRLLKKKNNYFDLSLGGFIENELYEKESVTPTRINNFRYSFSSFSNFDLSKKLHLLTSIYYQINSSNNTDRRIYLEPRLYLELNKISLYAVLRHRYHSTPYINVLRTDNEFTIGIELDI